MLFVTNFKNQNKNPKLDKITNIIDSFCPVGMMPINLEIFEKIPDGFDFEKKSNLLLVTDGDVSMKFLGEISKKSMSYIVCILDPETKSPHLETKSPHLERDVSIFRSVDVIQLLSDDGIRTQLSLLKPKPPPVKVVVA